MRNIEADVVRVNGKLLVRYRTPGMERLIEVGPYEAYARLVADALAVYNPKEED